MLLAEQCEVPRELTIGERLRGGDTQSAGETAIPPGDVAIERERFIFHPLRRCRHALAGRCRFIRTSGKTLEQPDAELRLDGVQAAERGRMVDAECFCGAREAACPMDRKHELGLVPVIHAAS